MTTVRDLIEQARERRRAKVARLFGGLECRCSSCCEILDANATPIRVLDVGLTVRARAAVDRMNRS